MCEWILKVVFISTVLGIVVGRSVDVQDEDLYMDLVRQMPPGFMEQLKDLQWGEYPFNVDGEEDWSEYDDDIIPGHLVDVPNWPDKAAKALIGQVGGIAMDTDGNLVVFHRSDRVWDRSSFGLFDRLDSRLEPISSDVITTIKPNTGHSISSFGAGQFYMPHGMTIDLDGNMWITDVGMHQVMKIPKGSTTANLTLGVKMEPGSDDNHFCKPTDVAVASNGQFFVADGYCNGRIMKFSPDGTLLKKWGHKFMGLFEPGPDAFHIPHSLALDESRDRICVADRENGRIQCFTAGLNKTEAGTFVTSFEPGRGKIYAIEYDSNADVMYAVNGPGIGKIEGFTLDSMGNILETWGPTRQDFGQPHDVTVSRDGSDVYVGDIEQQTKLWGFVRAASQETVLGRRESDEINKMPSYEQVNNSDN